MAAQPHHYQPQHAYRKSNLYGQNNSGSNSPIDVSPTSTHTLSQMPTHNRHPQAIRALKTPGYIPAALRRTEKPGRQSPPNIDSGLESPPSGLNTSSPYYTNSPGDMTPVNRIATEDMHSIYDDTPLSPVAGPITRNHWQVRCFLSQPPHSFSPSSHLNIPLHFCRVPILGRLRIRRAAALSSAATAPRPRRRPSRFW